MVHFIRLKCIDIVDAIKNGKTFKEFGLTLYCGRQGGGKSVGMTDYLYRMQKKYPDCLVYTNYGYTAQDGEIKDWRDLVSIRNGTKGVIFAIDEIQNEFDSTKWKTFPPWLLSEITQQRKQRIKIIGSSQVYTRVVKQLREQCFEVVECRTIAARWTFLRAFDADDYNTTIDDPDKKQKLRRLWRRSFIQTERLRSLFASYDKIQKLGERAKDGEFERREESA